MMLVILPTKTFSMMQKTAVRNLTMAKRVNGACTERPAKEQFSPIHKKYLRPKHCEFQSLTGKPRVVGQFTGQNDKSWTFVPVISEEFVQRDNSRGAIGEQGRWR